MSKPDRQPDKSRRRLPLRIVFAGAILLYLFYWLLCLPTVLFPAPHATILLDAHGELLSARTAPDQQWRLPPPDSVAPELRAAVLAYEDRTFHDHWGVSPTAIARAVRDNWRAGRVVSGGSTITMQVARMARGNKGRTLWQKFLEATWATRLEWRHSKEEILNLWLANAPFGGNAVGVEAASRRYYGRAPEELSWAEAATLAVLPNSPGLIHPGRSRDALRAKRDALLDDLVALGNIDQAEADLAKLEPLPEAPLPRPRDADHLLERLRQQHGPGRYRTTLEAGLQRRVAALVKNHQQNLAGNRIGNVACLVTEVGTGRVVAYVGNTPDIAPAAAPDVDIITSPRSPGSLLKPVLYGLAQENGTLLPRQLLPDVPTSFGKFRPANFYLDYDGAVPADDALARSLNIPFVHLLRDYGTERFLADLRLFGFEQVNQSADHYGLSMILGGGEITMEEINRWFLGLARQQRLFHDRQGMYDPGDWDALHYLPSDRPAPTLTHTPGPLAAGAGHTTLEALRELRRPDENGQAIHFASRRPVAWKTGTSFGFRDAWAVGCTPAYVVSVWAGNANGEGRPGLVGVKAAAPLLFRVFRLLDGRRVDAPLWFEPPHDELAATRTCTVSGYLAGPDCPADTTRLPRAAERATVCPHHERLFLDPAQQHRVRQDCGPGPATPASWFTLPAQQAYFYRQKNAGYRTPPPLHPTCGPDEDAQPMAFIYPYKDGVLHPGKNWAGGTEPILFELAHARPETTVHWHLDGQFLGSTTHFHTLTVLPDAGRHELTVVDTDGYRLGRRFEVR